MHLRRAATALLAARQAANLIPGQYCSPECPACRGEVVRFSVGTSCVQNSTFIINCGSCQQCIITFAIENGTTPGPNLNAVQNEMETVMNLCENTTVSDDIRALQSQASRISLLGVQLAALRTSSSSSPTATYSHAITASPTMSSWNSSSPTTSEAKVAITGTSSTQGSADSEPLTRTWVTGPVVGSILGMATVLTVIFFTRRKQQRDAIIKVQETAIKEFKDDDSSISSPTKAQLHSDCIPVRELENSEILPPVELPACEPVGSELSTPRDRTSAPTEDWPLPLSPLPLLFAMTELRDERAGHNDPPKHNTFYHP